MNQPYKALVFGVMCVGSVCYKGLQRRGTDGNGGQARHPLEQSLLSRVLILALGGLFSWVTTIL